VTRRVLLVDDEGFLRSAVAETLAMEGHSVEEASNVEEALAAFTNYAFDVVVTDLCLPDGSGMELLERLRALDGRFTAIVTTGFGTFEQAVSAIRLRVAAFLTKPFSVAELSRAIAEGGGAHISNTQRSAEPGLWRARADAVGAQGLLAELVRSLGSRGVAEPLASKAASLAGEALANAVSHAYPNETGSIELEIAGSGGTLEIQVRDAGCGFDPARAVVAGLERDGWDSGLIRFHREADAVAIRSTPGRGTSDGQSFRHAFETQSQRSAAPTEDELAVALLWS
jgi:ActR/RegA family two-component response regulator/anti-sigma regulatory factor (Ser/Thr protein kinase)